MVDSVHHGGFVVSRRLALGLTWGSVATVVTGGYAMATPVELDTEGPLKMQNGQMLPTVDELLELAWKDTGTKPPYQDEVDKARTLLDASPINTRPVDVAGFFMGIGMGEQGPDAVSYVEEWPVRWNPLITSFFDKATTYREWVGDTTHWCSAFVNYCILRSRGGRNDAGKLIKATKSAASRSFRTWGAETNAPMMGDVVVFEKKSDSGFGHVGFVISNDKNHVWVLGGNQRSKERVTTGQVCVSKYAKNGDDLKLHSFRTDPSLHDR